MNARWWWFGYALAAAVVLVALTWFTVVVDSGDKAERRAQRAAFADETARLALWRMDSQLATIVAREAGRPYLTYNAFYPAAGAVDRAYANINSGEVIVPSPLLGLDQPEVLLHVQIAGDGAATSPQVPVGQLRNAAVPGVCSAEQVDRYSERLNKFSRLVTRERLSQALDACDGGPRGFGTSLAFACPVPMVGSSRSGKEQVARTQNIQRQSLQSSLPLNRQQDNQALDYAQVVNDANKLNGLTFTEIAAQQKIEADIMRPLWFPASPDQDLLLLVRRVQAGDRLWLQACWLDWPSLRTQLLTSIRDLLPDADVVPAGIDGTWPHRLATLPLALRPGSSLPDWQEPPAAGLNLPLFGAWAGVITALVAGGLLLGGALALSERRGAFVSAVTHELRTPLTTFRLYTDLLAEGRVDDPSERRRCLDTLRGEAERLGHLVENVLSYARLERAAMPTTALGISALVDGMQGRLLERAQRANLTLTIDLAPDVRALAVRGEAQAIERILVNLVDNACKYAASAQDRRLHLELVRQGRQVAFRVRDHGPGIAADLRRRLFTPFAKSAAEAATTAPGIGLGLALSRRLAQQLGGDLRCEAPADGGAAFVLELPIA
jgi:signal transduction histidine kinase